MNSLWGGYPLPHPRLQLPPPPPPPPNLYPHRATTDLEAPEDAVRVEAVLRAAAVHHGRVRVALVARCMAVETTGQFSFRRCSEELDENSILSSKKFCLMRNAVESKTEITCDRAQHGVHGFLVLYQCSIKV